MHFIHPWVLHGRRVELAGGLAKITSYLALCLSINAKIGDKLTRII